MDISYTIILNSDENLLVGLNSVFGKLKTELLMNPFLQSVRFHLILYTQEFTSNKKTSITQCCITQQDSMIEETFTKHMLEYCIFLCGYKC